MRAVVGAARLSLKTPCILGSHTSKKASGDPIIQQFAVDPRNRAMAGRIVAGKLKGNMTVAMGRTAWFSVPNAPDASEHESGWFTMECVDFPAFGPTRPLFWLQGAISANSGPDGAIIGSLSHDAVVANVTDEDPEALEEDWRMIKAMLGPEAINAVGYEVRVDSLGRIASAKIEVKAGEPSTYGYTYPLEPVRIIPPDTQAGEESLQALFATLDGRDV